MGLGYDQLLNHWNTFANIYVASEHHLNLNIKSSESLKAPVNIFHQSGDFVCEEELLSSNNYKFFNPTLPH